MSDNKQQSGGQDRQRINVNQDYELRDWSKKFGVSPDELKRAVASAGTRAEDVERHLKGGSGGNSGGGGGSSGSQKAR